MKKYSPVTQHWKKNTSSIPETKDLAGIFLEAQWEYRYSMQPNIFKTNLFENTSAICYKVQQGSYK